MYFFFDTETNGLPLQSRAPTSDIWNWPRLIQLAWLVTDDEGNPVSSAKHLIKPTGFRIMEEAYRIHGISEEDAEEHGTDLEGVLEEVEAALADVDMLVAHNINFDRRVLGAEFLRAERNNPLGKKPYFCTMWSSLKFCNLRGDRGLKWPKLQELHEELFGKRFESAHDAEEDVRACARCFFSLKERGLIDQYLEKAKERAWNKIHCL